jgi:hypothetical protein
MRGLCAAHAALGNGATETAAYLLEELRKKTAAAAGIKNISPGGDERENAAGSQESPGADAAGRGAPAAERAGDGPARETGAAGTLEEILRQNAAAAETPRALFRQNTAAAEILRRTRTAEEAAGYAASSARAAGRQGETTYAAGGLSAAEVSDWFRRDARRYGASEQP